METPTPTHCAGCRKPLAGKHTERIGIQCGDGPEEVSTFCDKCARRMMRNVIRIEKQQRRTLIA